ncbi:MAG: hypothetical protein ACI379_03265 [Nocardioides sp.]|uniref:hypothetical protein n=1 Tax=Nocardioides sp. TaxID=35761 RepID=UPI003EFE5CA7
MRRLLPTVVVPLLALALLAPTAPAHAAAVTNKDLPTAKQIAKVYPKLRGEERHVEGGAEVAFPTDCDTETSLKGASGRVVAVSAEDMSVGVAAQVVEMKRVKQAKKVVRGFRALARCRASIDGEVSFRIKRIKTPKLGQERAALTMSTQAEGMTIAADFHVFRKKKRLVIVTSMHLDSAAQHAKSFKMAKVAYRRGI